MEGHMNRVDYRLIGPYPGLPIARPRPPYAGPMPTLCWNSGPLPESLRSHIDENGDLRCGDAVGLEAAWCLSEVDTSVIDPHRNYEPEDDYDPEDRRESRASVGCVLCGDELAETVDETCDRCKGVPMALQDVIPSSWHGWTEEA